MSEHVKIADASIEQLHAFVETVLGVPDLAARPQRKTLLLAIEQAAWAKDAIPVLTAALAPAPIDPEQTGGFQKTDEEIGRQRTYRRVIIARSDKPGGDQPVPLSVNGIAMYVERGKEQDIPEEYFGVLRDAVQELRDAAPDGRGLSEPRFVPMYPYSVVK